MRITSPAAAVFSSTCSWMPSTSSTRSWNRSMMRGIPVPLAADCVSFRHCLRSLDSTIHFSTQRTMISKVIVMVAFVLALWPLGALAEGAWARLNELSVGTPLVITTRRAS